ncbi:hypothetical protein Tco_1200670, partial [Tanacetum coccineum]
GGGRSGRGDGNDGSGSGVNNGSGSGVNDYSGSGVNDGSGMVEGCGYRARWKGKRVEDATTVEQEKRKANHPSVMALGSHKNRGRSERRCHMKVEQAFLVYKLELVVTPDKAFMMWNSNQLFVS